MVWTGNNFNGFSARLLATHEQLFDLVTKEGTGQIDSEGLEQSRGSPTYLHAHGAEIYKVPAGLANHLHRLGVNDRPQYTELIAKLPETGREKGFSI